MRGGARILDNAGLAFPLGEQGVGANQMLVCHCCDMPTVSIRHKTTYRYRRPVAFGEHRMMLRPHEAPDQRLLRSDLLICPQPVQVRSVHDLFGNCVDIARFERASELLSFESRQVLEHTPSPAFASCEEEIGGRGGEARFTYPNEERADLDEFGIET